MNPRRVNSRRVEHVSFWCRHCWAKGWHDFEWSQLEGKTLEELRLMCNELHKKICSGADVRLGDATKTR